MESNESEIIAQCIDGNWQNFDKLYDHYLPKIYQFTYYRIRHKQTAEDLTSTIFLKAVKGLPTFRSNEAPFGAWLYRIARNTVIDHTRTHKPTQDLETVYDLASKEDIADKANDAINLEAVRAGLSKLSEIQREVLIMRVWDELTHREIGEILDITEGNAKVIFSRAIDNLKDTIPLKTIGENL